MKKLFIIVSIFFLFAVTSKAFAKSELNIFSKLQKMIIALRETKTIAVINDTMQPNTFTVSFSVDGHNRVTIYTECVAGKDIPLHVWSSVRDTPRWHGLTGGDLKCGRPKTIDIQGKEYMIQYLGSTESVAAIDAYLVP